MIWLQAFGLALLLGFATWAGTRIGNWQDDRKRVKRIEHLTEKIRTDMEQNVERVLEAAEGVTRARQQDRGPDDGL